jgi:hypothetical protein
MTRKIKPFAAGGQAPDCLPAGHGLQFVLIREICVKSSGADAK